MSADPAQPHHADARALRHDIRGRLNALVLCTTALDETVPADEAVEFLTDIEQTAEKLVELLDRLEALNP